MTNEEIIAGNKLIAEFMGGVLDSPQSKYYYFTEKGRYETELKYHSSWDWLMSVVEKIESLGYWVEVKTIKIGSRAAIGLYNYDVPPIANKFTLLKISAVWLACLEFIKWYNEHLCQQTPTVL